MLNKVYYEKLCQKHSHTPWYTFPAIEYLLQLDLRDKAVFEWGSGESTLFFSERCKSIISIESNYIYYSKYNNRVANLDIRLVDKTAFASAIDATFSKFDIIIVDSEQRKECCIKAPSFLNPGGFIIVDNSNWLGKSCAMLRNHGFIQIDFHGMGAHNDYAWTTSIFFTRDFNMQPLEKQQPHCPLLGDLIIEK